MLDTCDFCHIKMRPDSSVMHSVHVGGHDATCCEWCFRFLTQRPSRSNGEPTVQDAAPEAAQCLTDTDLAFLRSANIRW